MKKLAILLSLILVTSCGGNNDSSQDMSKSNSSSQNPKMEYATNVEPISTSLSEQDDMVESEKSSIIIRSEKVINENSVNLSEE